MGGPWEFLLDLAFFSLQELYSLMRQQKSCTVYIAWDELPTEVYHYYEIKAGFRSRFDPTSILLTDAALVHPGHKHLNWLTPVMLQSNLRRNCLTLQV